MEVTKWCTNFEIVERLINECKNNKITVNIWTFGIDEKDCIMNFLFNVQNSYSWSAVAKYWPDERPIGDNKYPVIFYLSLNENDRRKLIAWSNELCIDKARKYS